MQTFLLSVEPENDNDFKLTLYQMPYKLRGQLQEPPQRLETLSGWRVHAVRNIVLQEIKKNGYDPSTLKATRRDPYKLNEVSGVRLALIFLAVKPLQKLQRVEEIIDGVTRMSNEEAFYWYAKCRNGLKNRALRALRILLSEEEG